MNPFRHIATCIVLLFSILPQDVHAQPGTFLGPNGFSYQGHLKMDDAPFTGTADFFFEIFDGFSQIHAEFVTNQEVIDGNFSLKIDLNYFDVNGNPLQLEVSVRTPPGVGEYVKLSPRQEIISVPYAMQSSFAVIANTSRDLVLPTTLESFEKSVSPTLTINQSEPTAGTPLRLTRTNNDNILEQYLPRVLDVETSDTPIGILATAQTFAIAGVIDENATTSGAAVLGQVNIGAPSSQVGVQALNQVGNTQALLATPDFAAIMLGEVRVIGDITKSYGLGAYDLAAPIAYGTVDFNGSILSGTPNFSCVYNTANTRYEIQIDNENYFYANYVTITTPISTGDRISTGSSSNRLLVEVESINTGNGEQGRFHFITYKPNGAALIQGQHRPPLKPIMTPRDSELNLHTSPLIPRQPIQNYTPSGIPIKQSNQ